MKKVLIIIFCFILILGGGVFYYLYMMDGDIVVGDISFRGILFGDKNGMNKKPAEIREKVYLCSSTLIVDAVLDLETMEAVTLTRGKEVERIGEPIEPETDLGSKYYKIEYLNGDNEKETIFVKTDYLSLSKDDIVKEKEMYVRTPTHVFNGEEKTIGKLINKGTKLEVVGYEDIDEETGIVKWYSVKVHEKNIEGYVRSKYLLDNEKEANEIYNENNIMDIHDERGNKYGAGEANKLDYYPIEKQSFESNVMPDEVNALYINSGSIKNASQYIEVAKGTRINAFVVDIKDNTTPAYPAEAMEKYSPTNYNSAKRNFNTEEEYKEGIKKLKDAGFYVIGRITVFKDANYTKDHPEHAVLDKKTNKPFLHNHTYWPSAYQRDVWKFNVELAKESVEKFGFNEIQFDYIRFPDRTQKYEINNLIDFKNAYEETKSQAIQRFLMYAVDELHDLEVYVAGDVFGEACNDYVTPYGQYWPAISNVVDVISPMAYPDHFSAGQYGFDYPWLYPYELITKWTKMAVKRQSETSTPSKVRPWVESHNTVVAPRKVYGPNEVSAQISAYYDGGLKNGFMTWWGSSSVSGYKSEIPAYKKEY